MVFLIPVKYHALKYPCSIKPQIQEIAAHFDKDTIEPYMPFSLHTEYSWTRRDMNLVLIQKFPTICSAVSGGIPMLWYSKQWAIEFANYIQELCGDKTPDVIEIHPPFINYSNFEFFIDVYRTFESSVRSAYPGVQLLIENRTGTNYKSKFLLSEYSSFLYLAQLLQENSLNLKITFDIPQLFTAHNISINRCAEMLRMLNGLKEIRRSIYGVHLWGKKEGANGKRAAHTGDLNSYFRNNMEFKQVFLQSLYNLLDDGMPRYFVPEVNSGQSDLDSIVHDLIGAGFQFAERKCCRYLVWAKTKPESLWTYTKFREEACATLIDHKTDGNQILSQTIQTRIEIPPELFEKFGLTYDLLPE